ncbi:acyltransferase family protein [Agrobacterium radiobacter]|uniref:acyltransferase family protein n=1 Tax=Agrobacterium radiobacter TaxID=362 RepID=UPI003CE51AB5
MNNGLLPRNRGRNILLNISLFYRLTMMKNFKEAPAAGAQRLDVLQVMRAVAATMIVALHADVNWQFTLFPLHLLRLGGGVDLFFVISGFVIVYASRPYFAAPDGRSAFLLRRFLRIVPLYWFVLTLRLAMAASVNSYQRQGLSAVTVDPHILSVYSL